MIRLALVTVVSEVSDGVNFSVRILSHVQASRAEMSDFSAPLFLDPSLAFLLFHFRFVTARPVAAEQFTDAAVFSVP